MMIRFNIGARIAGAIMIALSCCLGCGSQNRTLDNPPDIPPAGTFVIDTSAFTENQPSESGKTVQSGPAANFTYAALNVAIWNTILTVTMAVPVGAFVESFNHTPEQLADGTWQWSYSVDVDGSTYTAKLQATGAARSSDILWTMLISEEGGFTDVEWFTGVSNLAATEGTWSLNKDAQNVTPFLDIEWTRDPTSDDATIKYTNVVPGDANNGSYIRGEINQDATYDAQFVVSRQDTGETVTIEWKRSDITGRVMSEAFFSDVEWHCWNEMFLNTTCPQ